GDLSPDQADALRPAILAANTAKAVLELCAGEGIDLSAAIAERARQSAADILRGAPVTPHIVVVDREGAILARTD
ncbi:MAG TPA: cobalt-precorrin-5B (C(1))-methyltransferase, partial [Aurantimonas sp.]